MYQNLLNIFMQVICLVSQPELLDDRHIPEDVKKRARTILDSCSGNSVGNYR